jgi:hypothetical protein
VRRFCPDRRLPGSNLIHIPARCPGRVGLQAWDQQAKYKAAKQ